MMTDQQIAEIRERLNAATPGPLCVESVMSEHMHDICLGYPTPEAGSPVVIASVNDDEYLPISNIQAERNANFFAAAPTDIAALLAEVERLRTFVATRISTEHVGLDLDDWGTASHP